MKHINIKQVKNRHSITKRHSIDPSNFVCVNEIPFKLESPLNSSMLSLCRLPRLIPNLTYKEFDGKNVLVWRLVTLCKSFVKFILCGSIKWSLHFLVCIPLKLMRIYSAAQCSRSIVSLSIHIYNVVCVAKALFCLDSVFVMGSFP